MISRTLLRLTALVVIVTAACAHREAQGPVMSATVRHLTVTIAAPPAKVYAFAANPDNLQRWAAGLAGKVTRVGDELVGEGPLGQVRIRFAPANDFGVLDHDVTVPSGETVHNPVRVLPNRTGSEVVFSNFRREGVTDAQFAEDCQAVERDLQTLKRVVEAELTKS